MILRLQPKGKTNIESMNLCVMLPYILGIVMSSGSNTNFFPSANNPHHVNATTQQFTNYNPQQQQQLHNKQQSLHLNQFATQQQASSPLNSSFPSASGSSPAANVPPIPVESLFFPSNASPIVQHNGLTLTSSHAIAISRALEELYSRGHNANNNPAYSNLLNSFHFILKYHQHHQTRKQYQIAQIKALEGQFNGNNGLFSPLQHKQLLFQIKSLGHLVSEQKLPPQYEAAVKGFSWDKSKGETARDWQKNSNQISVVNSILGNRIADPCTVAVEAFAAQIKQQDVDTALLRKEREKIANHAISLRKSQLAQMKQNSANLAPNLAIKLEKERISLELIALQRKVRAAVFNSMPLELLDAGLFRNKKDIERENRAKEKQQKATRMKEDREMKKQRGFYLKTILNHARDFTNWHRERRRNQKKIADSLLKQQEEKQKALQNNDKQAERERLTALKENNEEEYIRLLKQAKNERLLQLIRQTDQYMAHIGAQLQEEQRKSQQEQEEKGELGIVAGENSLEAGADGSLSADSKEEQDNLMFSRKRYYSMAHRVHEEVIEQPASLVAGKLRSYQTQGLQWLVSLYNNKLNGILADEMGLGKTVQSCALIAHLMECKNNFGPFLIIVPMSTLHNNWEYEFDRW
jgi:hypothetical protein